MNFIIKLLCFVLVIRKNECSKNDCILDVVFLNKNHLYSMKDSEDNFTEAKPVSVIHNVVEYSDWNQVIKENITCSEEDDLPHDVVPEISIYEKGEPIIKLNSKKIKNQKYSIIENFKKTNFMVYIFWKTVKASLFTVKLFNFFINTEKLLTSRKQTSKYLFKEMCNMKCAKSTNNSKKSCKFKVSRPTLDHSVHY